MSCGDFRFERNPHRLHGSLGGSSGSAGPPVGRGAFPRSGRRSAHPDLRGGAEKLIQIYGWDLTADQVLEEADRLLDETYSTAVPLKPGAGELVRQFHEKGVPLCIATASTEGQAVGAMRHFGLADCFSFVLSCTRYGGKNRPDIFLEAARRFDLQPEEILLVEDSLYSVRTAHQAGFGTAGVADTSAETERAAMEQTCNYFFETLADFDVPVTAPERG
ncbi:MAG: HAD family phosphatase [Acutalibacteraceae bacterium]